jgi:type VI secretion system Hcp family effector
MTRRTSQFIGGVVCACVLAATVLSAQGGGAAVSQPVGTVDIEGVGTQATSIYSFGVSVTNSSTFDAGGGGGAGKAAFSNVDVTRMTDSLSPMLFRAAATGQHLASIEIAVFRAGSASAASMYTLEDAVIAGLETGDGMEQVSFSYRRVRVTVGSSSSCFDLAANTAC